MDMTFVGKIFSKSILLLICPVIIFTSQFTAFARSEKDESDYAFEYAEKIISYEKNLYGISDDSSLLSQEFSSHAGQSPADWFVIGCSRLGLNEDYDNYYFFLKNNITQRYKQKEKLDANKATEWHRVILSTVSCGKDPTDVDGINLIADGIYDREKIEQGLNGYEWALIALDSCNWKTPDNAELNRDKLISEILSYQLNDGSFSLTGNNGEGGIDITAMALQALAPYINDHNTKIRSACENALDYLSDKQLSDGDYGNCESTAQVLTAICSLGINYNSDKRFIKNKNIYNALIDYQNQDGGFSHIKGEASSELPSAQALVAIASAVRYQNSLRRVFDISEEFSQRERNSLNDFKSSNGDENSYSNLSEELKGYVYTKGAVDNSNNDFTAYKNKMTDADGYIFDIKKNKVFKYTQNEEQKKISDLNKKIMNGLYPFDNISKDDEKEICSIYEEANKLSKNDRSKIAGYNELEKAYKKINSGRSTIWMILTCFIVLMIIVLIVFTAKKRSKKSDRKNK